MNLLLLCITLAMAMFATAQPHTASNANTNTNTDYKVYYGLLHAHTMICDGSGTPEEAYAAAKQAGLHFFAVTPHSHALAESGAKDRKDGLLIANMPDLYNGNHNVSVTRTWKEEGVAHKEQLTITPLLQAAHEATSSNFVALYGQEFSTISSSNHVNVLGASHVLHAENGNFSALLTELAADTHAAQRPVLQLNHPDVASDLFYHGSSSSEMRKMYNDYGIDVGDLGPHFNDWITAMQPYTHLIEVLSGPAMATERKENYRYSHNENDYFFYLKQGLHISPSAGQDNHYKTWGTVTDARTGIIAKTLTEEAVYDAFRRNRTFVTEDKNLSVVLHINDSMMGASATAPLGTELNIKLQIEDTDEPNSDYELYLYAGEMQAQLSTAATNWKAADGLVTKAEAHGNGMYTIKGIFANGIPTFYYVKVVQNNNGRVWTAPVWINENTTTTYAPPSHAATHPSTPATTPTHADYYWTSTSSSKVYHLSGCTAVARIKPDNLRHGAQPPPGRTQHNCNVEE